MKLRTHIWAFLLVSAAAAHIGCSSTPATEQVQMTFQSFQRIPGSNSVAIILAEKNGKSFLPLSIDRSQALSIYMGQKEIPSDRPQSHDLMASMLQTLNAKLDRIVITDLRDNVYYAQLELRRGDDRLKVDARPSDAIALALRVDAPIFAMNHLLDRNAAIEKADDTFSQARVKSWGFTVQDVRGTLQKAFGGQTGVVVAQVEMDSPAEQAELQPGDLIQAIDRESVAGMQTFSDKMAGKAGEEQVELLVQRGEHQASHFNKA